MSRLNSLVVSDNGVSRGITNDQREGLLRRGIATVCDGEDSEAHVLNVAPGHTWEEVANYLQDTED